MAILANNHLKQFEYSLSYVANNTQESNTTTAPSQHSSTNEKQQECTSTLSINKFIFTHFNLLSTHMKKKEKLCNLPQTNIDSLEVP